MTRKTIAILLACLALASATRAGAAAKPNILVILTDDQRYDCLGAVNPHIHTPHMDRLAKEGVLFTHCYFMGGNTPAVCTPSRTMLMSGRTLFHLPRDIHAPGNKPSVPVMSTVFRQAGYDTFYCGKHGNTYHPADNSFDKSVFINVRSKNGLAYDDEVAQRRTYAGQIVRYLADPARAKKPFFVFFAPSIPHDPLYPEREDLALYAGDKRPPLPANAAAEHAALAGFNLRDTNIRTYDVPEMGHFKTPLKLDQWRDVLARYYAYVTSFDRQVGQILDELQRSGADKNTIVVFTSDNGHSHSDQGLIHKESVYEEDVRVPLIVRGPGIPAGKRSDALVYLSDLFPTLCQQIGVAVPPTVQTRSFLPSLVEPGRPHRASLYFAYRDEMRALRDGQYKIILFDNHRVRLFDLQADPCETRDLAKDPARAERVARLTAQAREAGKALGDDPEQSVFWKKLAAPAAAENGQPKTQPKRRGR